MNLYSDLRLGGVERLSIGEPEDWKMRIPDELLECVCFLCVEKPTPEGAAWHYGGTGFFVNVPNEVAPQSLSHTYLVTARHCVVQASKTGMPLFLRVNTVEGGAEMVRVMSESQWVYSEDKSADVAVLPWAPPRGIFNYRRCAAEFLLNDEKIAQHGIGPGDELIITGLFTARYGKQRNIPIVRTGIIAAMPSEPLFDEDTGLEYPAYIAEVRSIGGLSGSPVFVSLEPGRVDPKSKKIDLRRTMFLLGIVRGHWDQRRQTPAMAFAGDELESVNMGMALITPIQELAKILYGETLMKRRAQIAAEEAKKVAPTKDSAFIDQEEVFTRDDFEQALKKVAKKLPDSGKAQTSDE